MAKGTITKSLLEKPTGTQVHNKQKPSTKVDNTSSSPTDVSKGTWSKSFSPKQIWLYLLLPVCIAAICWQFLKPELDQTCYKDFSNSEVLMCKLKCPEKHFSLPWMDSCVPWLTNNDVESKDFKILKHIGNGAVKMVYLAEWKGHKVVLNTIINPEYREDFQHGLKMLRSFQGSPFVTQLLGYCKNGYITEYHPLQSADRLADLLEESPLSKYKTLKNMIWLCAQYVEIMNFLHTSPIGTRIMCDSNDLEKTLHQYLLRDDLSLIVNDLDALPEVNRTAGMLAKCGHRPIYGDFPAPEQLWPYDDKEFEDALMPPYDEKTDIWKIPNVCEHFLSLAPGHDVVLFQLFKIHKQCKSEDPLERPSAMEVLHEYKRIIDELQL